MGISYLPRLFADLCYVGEVVQLAIILTSVTPSDNFSFLIY